MDQQPDTWSRERLIAAAREAAKLAYAPYSRFRVGAAVVAETPDGGHMVTGANIENASYGLTICAERAALAAARMLWRPEKPDLEEIRELVAPHITHVAISCRDAPEDSPVEERMPCGACRQWLAELAPDAVYYVDGVSETLRLPDLMPRPFSPHKRG